jgi:ABC-type nitrate/sulfonate/bicarbonate transport system substrate-binding protein
MKHITMTAFAAGLGLTGMAQAQDEVNLQLQWVTQAQFAGYYVALENGYYDEENLDVNIMPGGPGHRAAAGAGRWACGRDAELDAVRTRRAGRPGCRWSTSPSPSYARASC